MNEIVKTFKVSSADWEIEVDDTDAKSAASSALLFLLNKIGGRLLLSTTIMVNSADYSTNDTMNANFFLTSSILGDIGEYNLSSGLCALTKNQIYEAEYS